MGTLLIVELGSPGFFGKHDGCAVGRNNSAKHYGTPTNKVSLQTKSGAGNTMVTSELTGGVDMMGLLVFSICYTYGRYIEPDQQGDCPTYLQPTRCFVTMRCSSRNMLLTDESLMKQHPFLSAMQQRHLIPTGLTERLQAPSIDG